MALMAPSVLRDFVANGMIASISRALFAGQGRLFPHSCFTKAIKSFSQFRKTAMRRDIPGLVHELLIKPGQFQHVFVCFLQESLVLLGVGFHAESSASKNHEMPAQVIVPVRPKRFVQKVDRLPRFARVEMHARSQSQQLRTERFRKKRCADNFIGFDRSFQIEETLATQCRRKPQSGRWRLQFLKNFQCRLQPVQLNQTLGQLQADLFSIQPRQFTT